jgi:mRNA interferase HigB
MLVANLASIEKFLRHHAKARKPMRRWVAIAEEAEWSDIVDARATWPTAEAILGTNLTCFDIGGNSFRLLAVVSYSRQEIVIRKLMTHSEYDKKKYLKYRKD